MDNHLQDKLRQNRLLWRAAMVAVLLTIAVLVAIFVNGLPAPNPQWRFLEWIPYLLPALNLAVIGLLSWDFAMVQRKIRLQEAQASPSGKSPDGPRKPR
jgi:hypothetical protein